MQEPLGGDVPPCGRMRLSLPAREDISNQQIVTVERERGADGQEGRERGPTVTIESEGDGWREGERERETDTLGERGE